MRNEIALVIVALSLTIQSAADQVLQEFTWENPVLQVSNAADQPLTHTVLQIDAPLITAESYAITGRVKYEDVADAGYLEMWSHFGPRGAFYSRTLADRGPMQRLLGSSDWREFRLPFQLGPDVPPPERLVVNVVLPGRGTVYLSSLRLVESGDGDAGAWFSERQAGLYGGVLGGVCGGLGALIGTLAARGRARALGIGLIRALILLGSVSLIAGIGAVFAGQPYHVFYPLLLIGILCAGLGSLFRVTARKQYEQWELRRMQALDA